MPKLECKRLSFCPCLFDHHTKKENICVLVQRPFQSIAWIPTWIHIEEDFAFALSIINLWCFPPYMCQWKISGICSVFPLFPQLKPSIICKKLDVSNVLTISFLKWMKTILLVTFHKHKNLPGLLCSYNHRIKNFSTSNPADLQFYSLPSFPLLPVPFPLR